MPRGGRRTGTPGVAYGNRSDLNGAPKALPVQVGPSQQYGQATAQAAAQKAMPMASGDLTQPAVPIPDGHHPSVPSPGSLPPLDGPTTAPDEHVMTGVGDALGPADNALNVLRALYKAFPTEDLRRLIEEHS